MSRDAPIRRSSPQVEGILQVSKWLKCQVLLDSEEMRDLVALLQPAAFFIVSQPVTPAEERISPEHFLEVYADYVQALQQGVVLSTPGQRALFSSALSRESSCFYAMQVGSGKALIKPTRPVIQLQAHTFFYSHLDGKFHPLVQSRDSISWGIQFSYPQLFQDPHTRTVVKVADLAECVNTEMFATLMRWMRSHTLPTPFVVNGVRTNSPIRLGKKALAWAGNHPQLKEKGIAIHAH